MCLQVSFKMVGMSLSGMSIDPKSVSCNTSVFLLFKLFFSLEWTTEPLDNTRMFNMLFLVLSVFFFLPMVNMCMCLFGNYCWLQQTCLHFRLKYRTTTLDTFSFCSFLSYCWGKGKRKKIKGERKKIKHWSSLCDGFSFLLLRKDSNNPSPGSKVHLLFTFLGF